MFLLASLAFALLINAADQAQNIAETTAVIAASVGGIIAAIMAARQKAKPKTAKPKPKAPKVVNTLSQEAIDEIGARR